MSLSDALDRLAAGEPLVIPARYLGAVQAGMEMRGGYWEVDVRIERNGRRATATLTPRRVGSTDFPPSSPLPSSSPLGKAAAAGGLAPEPR